MEVDQDRSTIEIKTLLHKLNPRGNTNHKDRVRALTRFRNFVSGASNKKKTSTAEFFDDDLPLLFLGSESPTALYDGTEYGDLSLYTGLFQACATPSNDQKGLKRSARNAMHLVKYLACDHIDLIDGEPTPLGIDAVSRLPELNPFAYALCSMKPSQLKIADFEVHLKYQTSDANARNGARIEACQVLVLLFTRHFDPSDVDPVTGSTATSPTQTLLMEDLLPSQAARQSFENWMVQNVSKDLQNTIKSRTTKAAATAAVTSLPNLASSQLDPDEDVEVDIVDAFKKKAGHDESMRNAMAEAEAHADQQLDELGIKLYKKDDAIFNDASGNEPPTTWNNSKLAKKQTQLASNDGVRVEHGVVGIEPKGKDEEKIKIQNAERQKLIGRDPLGIRPDNFDLKNVQGRAIEMLENVIEDIQEEMDDFEPHERATEITRRRKKKKDKYAYAVDQLISLGSQKNALEAILSGGKDDQTDTDGEEKASAAKNLSILPTDAEFNPMLFLTLVHRNASYEQLKESIERLDNQTDDQMHRIQERVRENFGLYIRCADGIDLFSDKAGKTKNNQGPGVHQRIDKLDELAASCSEEAKKSFKPLLDNTNEVRKVQSALSVLSRIGPLLQVPLQMRQHIENGRFSAAVKAYRRVLIIGDDNKIDLLANVKRSAAEAARDAREDLEYRLANPSLPVQSILDSIRDLGELNELDIPEDTSGPEKKVDDTPKKAGSLPRVQVLEAGKIAVGETHVDVRQYPPSLSCLMLQMAHFSQLVNEAIKETDSSVQRIFNGETLSAVTDGSEYTGDEKTVDSAPSAGVESKSSDKRERNRWKYDVLESRVISTIRVVSIARTWLPRLLSIAEASRQAEKRRGARSQIRGKSGERSEEHTAIMKTLHVFVTAISSPVRLLVEHGAFCALGCFNSDEGQELKSTYGANAIERLQKLIQSPLPSLQTSKCAAEFAEFADIVESVAKSAHALRPTENDYYSGFAEPSQYNRSDIESALDDVSNLVADLVITIERRKCIYAFDQCARTNSQRASGSGLFDGKAIVSCVQTLSEEITRPESCVAEIEKGCELVVHKSCEGLASYVRDRGDSARLRAVSECASALSGSIDDVVREISYLTISQGSNLEDCLVDDVLALEAMMFDEFLESIRRNMSLYCKLSPMMSIEDQDDEFISDKKQSEAHFPSHLSSSLLAIVRCRAQVEKALGETTIRKCQAPSTYLFLAMSAAADSVVDGICYEISQRMARMRGTQADQYLNELQFLVNSLQKYLSDPVLHASEGCKNKLLAKIGGGVRGQGPDGLGAIERLERLGRVYVMCLGD